MLLCLGFRDGGCLVKGFKILLYKLATFLACRSVAENTEDSSKVASTPSIFSVDSVISALVGKFPFQTEFAENEHLVKFLYFAFEANNGRYAVGNKNHRPVVICRYGNNTRTLWNHSYALRRGIGYGIAIQNEEGIPYRVMSVIINNTYHLLRPNGKDEECEEE